MDLSFLPAVNASLNALAAVLLVRGRMLARAQRIDRTMRRVGVLMPFAPDDPEARMRVAALEQGLRDLGWVEGKNLAIEIRWAGVNPQRQREHAAELKALPVALRAAAMKRRCGGGVTRMRRCP